MTEQIQQQPAQPQQPKVEEPKNPFAEFKTEEYRHGDEVKSADPEPKEEDAQPQKSEVEKPEGEVETPKEGDQQPPKEGDQQPPKKKQNFQERMNEVTRARREAERRAEAAERRAAQLEEKLRQAPPKEEQSPKKPDKPAADEVDPNAPNPDDYEFGELDSRYIGDLAEYRADKRFAELRADDDKKRREREQQDHQTEARAKFNDMVDKGSAKYEDFYEKVVEGSEKDVWPLSQEIGELILSSDVGDEIAYHLATHPEEAERIYLAAPLEQARIFGKLEVKFSAGQAAASGDGNGATKETGKPAPKPPKAPAPVEQARGTDGKFQASADSEDFAAFEARVNSGS